MNNKVLSFFALLASASVLLAAPLTQTTAIHVRPDATAPVISYLAAGAEPVGSLESVATTPAGWMAVELAGPFEAYVLNKDLMKSLDVSPGAPLTVAPKAGAGILTTALKGDKVKITGLHGKWTQISLDRKLVGYIALAPTSSQPSHFAGSAVSHDAVAHQPAPAPLSPPPSSPVAYGTGSPGRAAPMVNLGDGGGSSLPRQFSGRFVSTRRAFTPRRPFDWALNDDAGRRYAYLDVSKLLLTEQIEKYIDRVVIVYGAAKNAPDGKDIVIEVESLQLR